MYKSYKSKIIFRSPGYYYKYTITFTKVQVCKHHGVLYAVDMKLPIVTKLVSIIQAMNHIKYKVSVLTDICTKVIT